jgi:ankyrin repeat protein
MLNQAIISGDEEKVRTLLRHGVDLKDSPSDDSIRLALDNIAILKLLIIGGANVNAIIDSDNNSLLEWAIKEKEMQLVELLVQQGADVNYISKNSQDPLVFCAIENLPEFYLHLFFDQYPGLIKTRNKWNIPVYGIMIGKKKFNALMNLKSNQEAFEYLLNQRDIMLRVITAWSENDQSGEYVEFADFLVFNGYDLNSGYGYLQYAIWELNFEAFKWLLDNGASPLNVNIDHQMYYGYGTPAEVIMWRKDFMRNPKKVDGSEYSGVHDTERINDEEVILDEMKKLLESMTLDEPQRAR